MSRVKAARRLRPSNSSPRSPKRTIPPSTTGLSRRRAVRDRADKVSPAVRGKAAKAVRVKDNPAAKAAKDKAVRAVRVSQASRDRAVSRPCRNSLP